MSAPAKDSLSGLNRSLVDAFAPLREHFAELDGFLEAQRSVFEPEIREMAAYSLASSGKRIRPSLVFFAGWDGSGQVRVELVKAAAIIEMVHLATLVHDDIMDRASIRRGRATLARRYGAEAAVLLGDALFSQALRLAAEFPTPEVCRWVAEATRRVCSGEIIQTLNQGDFSLGEDAYWRVIELKTAELFRVSCLLGGRLGGQPEAFCRAAEDFGRELGLAYQMYDDLADFFGHESRIGKTLGTDFLSGKATLPVLRLMARIPPMERDALEERWSRRGPEELAECARRLRDHGIGAEVLEIILRRSRDARARMEAFAPNPAAACLASLAEILERQAGTLPGLNSSTSISV